jgi:putative cell wall-binding protein
MALHFKIISRRTDKKRVVVHRSKHIDAMSAWELIHKMNAPIRI